MAKSYPYTSQSIEQHEEFLKFNYQNPHIYACLTSLAKEACARGDRTLELNNLLEQISDTALEKFKHDRHDAMELLAHYQAFLETDFTLWRMFHQEN